MFLYINYRKNSGMICCHGFDDKDKIKKFILEEIKNQIFVNKEDFGIRADHSPKKLEEFMSTLNNPTMQQLQELIKMYEEWATPFCGPALIHEIQERNLIKDCQ